VVVVNFWYNKASFFPCRLFTGLRVENYMSRVLASQTPELVKQSVTLKGWVNSRRDHGGVIFIDLRDHTGLVQVTIRPEAAEAFAVGEKVRDEYVVSVTGQVVARGAELVNKNIPTGGIEVVAESVRVLNASKPLPFQVAHGHVSDSGEVNEELRLKYRFLDMRREKIQRMLRRKDEMVTHIREHMHSRGFTEVTTPILTSSSPEGARDYLVPSRLHPGQFYALPQAPQQFKQLLMVGGLPKYFQIAPCFRDEDPLADRHPGEFYQLDLEIAFAEKGEEVWNEMEPLVIKLTEEFAGKKCLSKPFQKLIDLNWI
jgi:aspartyl-tRNA synthetase